MLTLFEGSKCDIAILVLAAGSASRFGSAKQLALWKGKPLLSHVLDGYAAGDWPVYFTVGANRTEILANDDIKACLKKGSVPVMVENWKDGQSASIRSGVKAVVEGNSNLKGIVITLGDQPFVDANAVAELLKDVDTDSRTPQIVCARYPQGKGVPVFFSKDYVDALFALEGDQGARKLIEKFPHRVVEIKSSLIDIDTRDDLERFS